MCGLTGIAGTGIQQVDLDILSNLATISALRGTDAAGIMQGRTTPYHRVNKTTVLVEKMANDINYFQYYNKWHPQGNKEAFKGLGNNFFAVHCRSATKGSYSKANAHPFDVGRIVGMHNGTLHDRRYEDKERTDSELLLKDMSERGEKQVLEGLISGWDAFALVWIDRETGYLSFANNGERDLFYCYSDRRSVIYWASETWMLRAILARNKEIIHQQTVYKFLPDLIYTIDVSKSFTKQPSSDFTVVRIGLTTEEIREKAKKRREERDAREKKLEGAQEKEEDNSEENTENTLIKRQEELQKAFGASLGPAVAGSHTHFRSKETKKREKSEGKAIECLPFMAPVQDRPITNVIRLDAGKKLPIIRPASIKEVLLDPKIPTYRCCSCDLPMTPVQVHYAEALGTKAYVCQLCIQEQKRIADIVGVKQRENLNEVMVH